MIENSRAFYLYSSVPSGFLSWQVCVLKSTRKICGQLSIDSGLNETLPSVEVALCFMQYIQIER